MAEVLHKKVRHQYIVQYLNYAFGETSRRIPSWDAKNKCELPIGFSMAILKSTVEQKWKWFENAIYTLQAIHRLNICHRQIIYSCLLANEEDGIQISGFNDAIIHYEDFHKHASKDVYDLGRVFKDLIYPDIDCKYIKIPSDENAIYVMMMLEMINNKPSANTLVMMFDNPRIVINGLYQSRFNRYISPVYGIKSFLNRLNVGTWRRPNGTTLALNTRSVMGIYAVQQCMMTKYQSLYQCLIFNILPDMDWKSTNKIPHEVQRYKCYYMYALYLVQVMTSDTTPSVLKIASKILGLDLLKVFITMYETESIQC